MPSPAAAQKLHAPNWAASDKEFTLAFYKPYEAAVETAFLMLGDARSKLSRQRGEDCVRAITFRLKSPESIRGKLLKKGLPASAEAAGAALDDISGLRVVLASVSDVYRFADLLRDSPVAECIGTDDYIASPKESGYRSLHLLMYVPVHADGQNLMVPVEIQLRTASMDLWASIEHDICYKPQQEKRMPAR